MLDTNPILLQQLYYFYHADPKDQHFDLSLLDNSENLFGWEDDDSEPK
jgi:hypothetical protein